MQESDPPAAEPDEDATEIMAGGFRGSPPDRHARRRSTMRALTYWAAVSVGALVGMVVVLMLAWAALSHIVEAVFADLAGYH